MAIEEALNGTRVREIVVDGTQRVLKSLELGIGSDLGAIHTMQNLCIVSLQVLDALVNFLVALSQSIQFLERCSNDPSYVAESLAVPHQAHRKGEICIAEDSSISERVYELETREAADSGGAGGLGDRSDSGVVVLNFSILGSSHYLCQISDAIIIFHDVAQLLVGERPQELVSIDTKLPTVLESRDGIARGTYREGSLSQICHVPVEDLTCGLPHVCLVWNIPRLGNLIDFLDGRLVQDVLYQHVIEQPPLCEEGLDLFFLFFICRLLHHPSLLRRWRGATSR
mmetsp:Transcript_1126/g.2481  ORF Transcript_1126/g.2481 Transcript_1126/m.2481 type:complete len:284 (-) Transcript_1126:429-1280(-)